MSAFKTWWRDHQNDLTIPDHANPAAVHHDQALAAWNAAIGAAAKFVESAADCRCVERSAAASYLPGFLIDDFILRYLRHSPGCFWDANQDTAERLRDLKEPERHASGG